MKIICVGWNYPDHNTEMKHESVGEPLIFMKPDSALLRENKPFFIPDFSKQVEYEVELVVRINRLGKNISEKFASRYYEEVALGVDFTARDLQQRQRALGAPWEIAKAFDNSAVISDFIPLSTLANAEGISFSLSKNGVEVQRGNTRDMLFSVNQIIAYVSQFFTLKIGDLIYTGTPAGVGPVVIGDYLEGFIEGNKMLNFFVK
ncbi:MAG: fumarylacetoacetate hydrolase family protein [Paludibacteraceae bacterium]|jgi:2-keto-4-pentenoate hydratase/2-oxohepta-3-ene-1,7-dioic acid hydratase in catechol pathway|nr:fumarylacetoacetate hydrolase family protein [Paludibacteraceae bacterium]